MASFEHLLPSGKALGIVLPPLKWFGLMRSSLFSKILLKFFSSSKMFDLSHHLVQVGGQKQWIDLICVS